MRIEGNLDFRGNDAVHIDNLDVNVLRAPILSVDKVTAEAFYLSTGGELITGVDVRDGDTTYLDSPTLTFNPVDFYLSPNSQGRPTVNLNLSPRISELQILPPSSADVTSSVVSVYRTVPGLQFGVQSGSTYQFKFTMFISTSVTTEGFNLMLDVPASTIFAGRGTVSIQSGTNGLFSYPFSAANTNFTVASQNFGPNIPNFAVIEGVIKPSANGYVQLRFFTETAVAAATTTIHAGSFVEFRQLS